MPRHEDTCREEWRVEQRQAGTRYWQRHTCRRDKAHRGEHTCSCGVRVD